MKKRILITLITGFLLHSLSAMELTTSLTTGNLGFDRNSTATLSSFSGTTFPWGISLYGKKNITDNISIKAGLFYDPILRYTTKTLFLYRYSFFQLGLGPFFGIFNTPQTIMKSGISTSVHIELPGIVFATFEADSSIGARFVKVGDYIQEKNKISLGYYIPNAICSVNLITKSFVVKQEKTLEVDDSFTEYSFKTDIYQKNVAFRALLSFGYQTLSRSYLDTLSGKTTSNTLNSLIFGSNFTFRISKNLSFSVALDSNIYSFGYQDATPLTLPDSGIGLYLFRLTTGITVKI